MIKMASSSATFDIVLLFGPAICNKPDYLSESCLSGNVEIICPDDLYKENSEYGLRDIALKVVAALKQSKQVLINDELHSKLTRKSFLETVMKKVPSCRVQLVQVIPKYGFLQVMWSLQFSYVGGLLATNPKEEEHLRRWFDDSLKNIDYDSGFVDRPCEKEGYVMEILLVPLQVNSHFKLECPALFLQFEGVLNEKMEFRLNVEELCDHWATENPCGHILFISDDRNRTKGILSSSDESKTFMRCLKRLSLKIKHPVYYIQTSTGMSPGSFCVPPQPGILAFLQLQHLLNLHSQNTCYIFNDVNHMKMAEAAGVRHMKISALRSPDMVLNGHGLTPAVPAMLRTMVVKKPNVQHEKTIPQIPTLPLFDLRHDIKDGYVSRKFDNGLEEYIFVKDIQSFSHYQEKCAQHVTPIDHPGSKLSTINPSEAIKTENVSTISKRSSSPDSSDVNIPHWMMNKMSRQGSKDGQCITGLKRSAGTHSDQNNCRSSKTVYVMSEKEAVEMARQLLLQAGHKIIDNTTDQKAKKDDPG